MREVIFEVTIYNGIKGGLKTLFCSHVECRIIDRRIIDIINGKVSIIIWECIRCKRRILWILKEIK